MNTPKKTALTGAAAAALLVVGAATPAMASDETSTTSKWYEIQKHTSLSNTSPVVIAPDLDLLGGGIANGDNLNGNVVGSGNDILGDVGGWVNLEGMFED